MKATTTNSAAVPSITIESLQAAMASLPEEPFHEVECRFLPPGMIAIENSTRMGWIDRESRKAITFNKSRALKWTLAPDFLKK